MAFKYRTRSSSAGFLGCAPSVKTPISEKLLRWYSSQRRSLPWREKPEPYAVWVAEIMAQQTRLETMVPYYRRWMQRFPDLRSLALASEQQVLVAWEGLGYYSRARNLRYAALQVQEKFGGELPRDAESLRSLPGIGPYTAGAIASLAFGLDEIAVDGNTQRVLARLFDVNLPLGSSKGQQQLWALAAEHLPPGWAAEYNQALMDLGAEICTPRRPNCAVCPLAAECRAYAQGIQEQRPVKALVRRAPLRNFAAAVIQQRGQVLLVKRPASGLLAGMWEFPNTGLPSAKRAKSYLRQAIRKNLGIDLPLGEQMGVYEHAYSHFRAHVQVYVGRMNGKRPRVIAERPHRWLKLAEAEFLPMGKLDRRIANVLLEWENG